MFGGAVPTIRYWRVAALALLLCAAFDILAVDTGLWRPAGAESACGCPPDEDCFCCSRQIVVVEPMVLRPLLVAVPALELDLPQLESVPQPPAFHPPRIG